jgi:hypothetical protein
LRRRRMSRGQFSSRARSTWTKKCCPRCEGRIVVRAVISDLAVARQLLDSLARNARAPLRHEQDAHDAVLVLDQDYACQLRRMLHAFSADKTGTTSAPLASAQSTQVNGTTSESDAIREGDIIFQTSRSSQRRAIQLATNSTFSHMGIVQIRKGSVFVFEAVGPVKLTPLGEWIARGDGSHYTVMRLKRRPRARPALASLSWRLERGRTRGGREPLAEHAVEYA